MESEGARKCQTCNFWQLCLSTGTVNPTFNFPFVIGVCVGLIIAIGGVKVVQLIIRGARMWKPQSEADAAHARKFIVPKKSAEMIPSISLFQECQEGFEKRGWTAEQP